MNGAHTEQDRLVVTAAAACVTAHDPLIRSVHVVSARRPTYPEFVMLRLKARGADVELVAERPDDLWFRDLAWERRERETEMTNEGRESMAARRLRQLLGGARHKLGNWNGGFVGIHEGVR